MLCGAPQVQVIVSGIGDWRYVDCVSNQGGKLQALEYVRSLFNIPRSHCVSAGDSGNDILMLQGEHFLPLAQRAMHELLSWEKAVMGGGCHVQAAHICQPCVHLA